MAAASFHQERPFEQVFADAHAHMTASSAEGYMVTVLETAGVTHNVFDWDAAHMQYRHYKLSTDPTVPLNRVTGSMHHTVYYAPAQVNAFRHDMMLATRSALQTQTIQYYRADREPQLVNTGFPVAHIVYPRPGVAMPAFHQPQPQQAQMKPQPPMQPLQPSSRYRRVVLVLLILVALALLVACCYYR